MEKNLGLMVNYLEDIKGKDVLVTGGLGFVGHNLVKTLCIDYGCDVIVVDDCSNSDPSVLDDVKDKVDIQIFSVLESEKLLPLFKKVDYIFHLACKQISASGKDPLSDLRVNAESTLNMLEALRTGLYSNIKRFVYTSSCSVYGSSTNLPTGENDATRVLSNYAATKLLGENYTLMYARNYGVNTASVRYSNVFGYGQSPNNPYCGVLGIFVHNALTGQPLSIFGDGEQTRDYTFITDAVNATILAAVHPMALGDVFNIGTTVETSVNKLAEIIQRHVPETSVTNVPERDIDNIRRRAISIEKIHHRLGWVPKVNVAKGIEETIEWYRGFLQSAK